MFLKLSSILFSGCKSRNLNYQPVLRLTRRDGSFDEFAEVYGDCLKEVHQSLLSGD